MAFGSSSSIDHPSPWSYVLRDVVLPIGDRLIGQEMIQRLKYLEEAQWWDRERIYELRDEQLRHLVQVAYTETSFYRDLMNDAGVKPDDIQTAADLTKLPPVTKSMYRETPMEQRTRDTGRRTFNKCSSGSTGEPFCVKGDSITDSYTRASTMLNFGWAGWQIGVPYFQSGINLPRKIVNRTKDALMRCYYVSAYDLSNDALDRNLDAIDRYDLKFITGYPSSTYWLAKRAQEVGFNSQVEAVITWGDKLYPHYKELIESAFKTRIYDKYGCGEGFELSAQTSGSGDFYVINSLDVIIEFVDDAGLPVANGEPGNITVTRLLSGPHPFIRYQVGDVGISGGDALSPCGRGFDTMREIQGRDTDIVITPGGNRLIVHFFTGILEYFPEIRQFQVIQEDADSLLLKIVPAEDYNDAVEQQAVARLREFGADIAIQVELIDEIPITGNGKRRFVINEWMQNHR